MIEELQRTVITLSRENKDLNDRNEGLRRQLMEIGTKVRSKRDIVFLVRTSCYRLLFPSRRESLCVVCVFVVTQLSCWLLHLRPFESFEVVSVVSFVWEFCPTFVSKHETWDIEWGLCHGWSRTRSAETSSWSIHSTSGVGINVNFRTRRRRHIPCMACPIHDAVSYTAPFLKTKHPTVVPKHCASSRHYGRSPRWDRKSVV